MDHLKPLDGMRAIAVLIVFIAHCGLDKIVPGGMGVTIFFFLSGYLITSLMRSEVDKTGSIDLKAFYIRRTLRIWPPLYISMAVTLAIALIVPYKLDITFSGIVSQILFFNNYAGQLGIGAGVPWMPLWSLAVEEHFYIFFPLLYVLLFRSWRPAHVALACAIGCVIVLLVRIYTAAQIENIGAIYYWSHTRIDSILFGCCLAMWQNPALDKGAWRPKAGHAAAAIAVLLACLVLRDPWFRQTFRYSLQGVALFVIFGYALSARGLVITMLSGSLLRIVALFSYTLYLIHPTFIAAIEYAWPDIPRLILIATAGATSMGYAALMYHFVEQPAARMRRRLHKVDAQATQAVPLPAT
ncbi:acyltransferase family protein [Sphingomonas sp. NPDC019816]|uniref:acyltransferase family protein n=1 Tax=Sphingomonas sp. NPDC019816 TaxID=3390679 RepID=UPI003D02375A